MSNISLGLSSMVPDLNVLVATLMLTNLTDGQAQPGETLQAMLSDGMPIDSYMWGSSAGSSDLGTDVTLVVPLSSAGGVIHVTVQAQNQTFVATVPVMQTHVPATMIVSGPGLVNIQDLASPSAEPGLRLSAGPSSITVEIV